MSKASIWGVILCAATTANSVAVSRAETPERIVDLDIRGYPDACRLDSQSIPCNKIIEALTAMGCARECDVHIHVAKSAKYEDVSAVLSALQGHGLAKIGFVNDDLF
jgi:biopolymer transport protein ExbD